MKSLLIVLVMSALGLVACNEGPAERFGQDIDDAVEDAGNAVDEVCEDGTDAPCL